MKSSDRGNRHRKEKCKTSNSTLRKIAIVLLILACNISYGQGYNSQWLLGYFPQPFDNGRFTFSGSSGILTTEQRDMGFWGTQANICDANGNFLMSSNGVWIADATNDTMLNGSGLNPAGITPNWPNGLPMVWNNAFIPLPGDTSKYILLHHSASVYNGVYSPVNDFYRTVVDMTLNGGLGGVILKNDLILNDTINGGIGLCKHANGEDWWAVVHKDSSDVIFKILITNNGIASITSEHLNYLPLPWGNFAQLSFSPDGKKFCSTTYNTSSVNSYIVLADFDRCNGTYSNTQTIQVTNNENLFGLAFSPNGNYVYTCSGNYIYQVDVNTLTVDTVAVYDGFISPPTGTCCATTFWNMYLAANGKVYVSSGNGVMHITVINQPDSAGLACDVQQHAIDLQTYRFLRAVPNHPNYYLGCDTSQTSCPCLTGVSDVVLPDFKFNVYPNPVTNGTLHIGYLLPQKKSGVFEMYDVTGNVILKYMLPPWSNEQSFVLLELADGVYNCTITSDGKRVGKKVAVIKP